MPADSAFAPLDALLSDSLGRAGLVPSETLSACSALAQARGVPLGEALLSGGHLEPSLLEEAYARLPQGGSGPLHLGELVAGRYRVEGLLGQGGMGAVYRVLELESQRALALKVILPGSAEELDLLRFKREGEVAARLSRAEGFVRVHSGGEHRKLPYFVMDLVEGQDLESALTAGMSPNELARVLVAVADALQTGHEAGLIHRDLKPANLLLGVEGPRIADLGLVRDRDAQTLTQSGELLGTPAYMAPEQIADARSVDARTDVYALGAILYRGLAGRAPFSGGWIQVLSQVIDSLPPRPSRVTGGPVSPLEAVCLKAMAKDPGNRYADTKSMADDLRRVLAGESALATTHWSRPAIVAVVLLALVAGGLLWSSQGQLLDSGPGASPSPGVSTHAQTPAPDAEELARLRQSYQELLRARSARLPSALSRSKRLLGQAQKAGLSLEGTRELKREAWRSAAEGWSQRLEGLASSPGGNPALGLAALKELLLAPPAVSEGLAEVTSGALVALLRDPADNGRAIQFQIERIALGLPPPLSLQQRALKKFDKDGSEFGDCLRLDVPVQIGFAHNRVRRLAAHFKQRFPSGQLDGFVTLAVACPKVWPNGGSSSERETVERVRELAREALDGRPDLGQRYVLEAQYLYLKARVTLAHWDSVREKRRDPIETRAQAEEARRLGSSKASPALTLEFARLEASLLQGLGDASGRVEAWIRAVETLASARSSLNDCPELYLAAAYRGLAFAQSEGGSLRESLKSLDRSLEQAPKIYSTLSAIGGGKPELERDNVLRKGAALAARAHLDLGQLDLAEGRLKSHLNARTFKANHDLGFVAVLVAIERGDRKAAVKRLKLFADLKGEGGRLADLKALFEEKFPAQVGDERAARGK